MVSDNIKLKELLTDQFKYIPKFFRVINKSGQLVPMNLMPAQELYLKERTHRDIIVKWRQGGLSTGVLASNAHTLFTQKHERQVVIAHNRETSEYLLQTTQRFWRNLPESQRPKVDWRSSHRMRFPLLDSYIYVDSAEADNIGIGHTISRCHLSEVPRWSARKADDLFTDISQTVPMEGYITLESTPKGKGGLFYNLYMAAKKGEVNYKPFFFPWWFDPTCIREVLSPREVELQLSTIARKLGEDAGTIKRGEELLRQKQRLTEEQLSFRREKLLELKEYFFQEYPENDVDCWMANETSLLDPVSTRQYLQEVWQGRKESEYLTIWKDFIGGHHYVVGVDVAAGVVKGDFSVAVVIDVRTNEYVARLKGRIPPDMFAVELLRLCRRYNDPLCAVERTGHGGTVIHVMLQAGYPNLYYYNDYDVISKINVKEAGWKTSYTTKPIMISTLRASVRAHDIFIWSEDFFEEAGACSLEEERKIVCPSGYHDDELDAVMIALQVREQEPISLDYDRKPGNTVKQYARL